MERYKRGNPTPEIVRNAVHGSGGTGSYAFVNTVRIPLVLTSVANGTTNWVNPEAGTVLAKAFLAIRTAGTGTFDMGRGSDGTGNANGLIDGGTLTVGVHHPGTVMGTVAASATLGLVDNSWILVGPGGTGANNSINLTHSDTATSTAAGELIVQYFLIG
jgi:hypothetical protein